MHSQLAQFCQQFESTVRPLLEPLQRGIDALAAGTGDAVADDLRLSLVEQQHQVETLVRKVAEQQAYVLIFGPLKSGKSTLMNAVSGAYVSEVSALPAYPCMVFVGHGKQREFRLSSYDGTTKDCKSAEELSANIELAHTELARHLREAEDARETFDPQEHYPAAIRRVDVRVDAAELAKTGAYLVDTPGLYTRMRFGYDRMTKDFRNAAACAVFVVKTDNLFLEQVFTEFNQLLELFSRIYLVINLDTTKRDVGPDGQLQPSLERRSPERVLEAFETLAMSPPLRQAAKEGRVKIYPVDLMHAASASLSNKPDAKLPPDFVAFRDDLHEYLASTEYMVSFLGDSLRRAQTLLLEADTVVHGDNAAHLMSSLDALQRRRDAAQSDLEALRLCRSRDWSEAFGRVGDEVNQEVQRRSRDHGARMARNMNAAIDTWWLASHSLYWLIRDQWGPQIDDYRADVAETARHQFERTMSQPDGGLDVSREDLLLLRELGIDLRALRREIYEQRAAADAKRRIRVPIDCDEIPLRRGLMQVVTMRSAESVRRKLFGPREKPDNKIQAKAKAARLGEPGKAYLREQLQKFHKALLKQTVQETMKRYGEELQTATIEALDEALAAQEPGLVETVSQLDREIARLRDALAPIETLRTATDDVRKKMHALSSQYASEIPELVAALEASEPDTVLQPQRAADRRSGSSSRRRRSGRAPH